MCLYNADTDQWDSYSMLWVVIVSMLWYAQSDMYIVKVSSFCFVIGMVSLFFQPTSIQDISLLCCGCSLHFSPDTHSTLPSYTPTLSSHTIRHPLTSMQAPLEFDHPQGIGQECS